MDKDAFQEALDAALQYLGPRPRSIWEVRQRLRRRGLEPEGVDEVVARLQELGFLDDAAFAGFWIENRESFRPRGRRLLELELRQRGVETEALEERLSTLDEEDSALRAARSKARGLASSSYAVFAAKVSGFLRRRGFYYEVVSTVTRRLWREANLDSPEGDSQPGQDQDEDDQD